jgi:hypothetical protein
MNISQRGVVGIRAVGTATAVLVLAVAAACGGGADRPASVTAQSITARPTSASSGPSVPPSVPPSTTPGGGESPTPTKTRRPTRHAADDLAPFFAEARLADGRLRTAAALVNADLGTEPVVHFREATVAAARATWPTATARAIPAGLPPDLLRAVLLVYSDLADRSVALRRVGPEADRADLLNCLHNGQEPAARFPADLATAQKLAAASPAVVVPPPDSRAVAEVALHLLYLNRLYGCDDECGGPVAQPPTITWKANPPVAPGAPATDGTIGGLGFRAKYQPGRGWEVDILAC